MRERERERERKREIAGPIFMTEICTANPEA
jgi:hypothetical protein